jgi:hypothetical protein
MMRASWGVGQTAEEGGLGCLLSFGVAGGQAHELVGSRQSGDAVAPGGWVGGQSRRADDLAAAGGPPPIAVRPGLNVLAILTERPWPQRDDRLHANRPTVRCYEVCRLGHGGCC